MKLILLKEYEMKLIETTYRTFSGTKKVIEIPNRRPTQWIIYQDDKPAFYVDLYDLSIESNAMMNSLVLCAKKSMESVLAKINKKNNINLSLIKISKLGVKKKIKTTKIEIDLGYLPEEWLDYSL
ncbi:hypothetical protein SAMN04487762_0042 [Polaribacter sp. Hel1_33_78]|jgi:hypothetical protein|uniref:hypothetical protein n=1 Tax=unclassified Polaribacter TaxID=196858 RepID=UPI00052D4DAA|nr:MULTISPECIES: hypothetical protein [unclassified Polaribacter]KGL60201.1 hypothetical protein PHEL49_1068 [Polaribacter sp. Hel1_33_49]PKV66211.1 hypothetical protein ATE90_2670 [Polaribacter sp. Hel1_33_96]SDT86477.1 hypothetical protein SAMN04487762_0042 [Polaribacter sp. Hel1_33_78]